MKKQIVKPADPMDDLDREVRDIVTRAATDLMTIFPKYVGVNPARVMRLSTTMASAFRRILSDVGAGDGHNDEYSTNDGLPVAYGSGMALLKNKQAAAGVELILEGLQGPLADLTLPVKVNSLMSALSAAKQIGDDDLADSLKREIGLTMKTISAKTPAEVEDHESYTDLPTPEPINENATYEDA